MKWNTDICLRFQCTSHTRCVCSVSQQISAEEHLRSPLTCIFTSVPFARCLTVAPQQDTLCTWPSDLTLQVSPCCCISSLICRPNYSRHCHCASLTEFAANFCILYPDNHFLQATRQFKTRSYVITGYKNIFDIQHEILICNLHTLKYGLAKLRGNV